MKLIYCLLLVLAAGCRSDGIGIVGHKDSGDDTLPDLAVDSTNGDMNLTGADLSRTWKDESYTGYVDGGSLSGVWNNDAGTVIAVGDYGKILRSQQGGTFTQDPSTEPAQPALTAIYGVPGPDVFVVGLGGALWKWGGGSLASTNAWNPDLPGTENNLWAVWVPTDGVGFVGGDGVILQRVADTSTSSSWTQLANGPATGESALGIWAFLTGPSQYDAFAVGCVIDSTTGYCTAPRIWHYTNGAITKETAPAGVVGLFGVWGSGDTDIYAVADSGTIIHSTGNGTWTKQSTGLTGTDIPALLTISGSGPDEIYATGYSDSNGTLFFHKFDHTSTTWTRDNVVPAAGRYFYALSVTATDIYMVGESGAILHK